MFPTNDRLNRYFSKVVGVGNNVDVIQECEQLIIDGTKQGVSLIAVDKIVKSNY